MLKRLKKIFKRKLPPDFRPVNSYSQDGEDMILKGFYDETPDYKGFFVDVGALHPFRFSNTQYFYEKGWQGINIEPTPNGIDLFNKYRQRDINLNIGIANKESELTFHCFNEPALNSFDKKLSEERNKPPYKILKRIPIKTYPLAQVLDQHLPAGRQIDFMSIDVEGLDYEVLISNNWDKYKPKYILAEDIINFEQLKDSKVYALLSGQGYELVAKTLRTLIFKQSPIAP